MDAPRTPDRCGTCGHPLPVETGHYVEVVDSHAINVTVCPRALPQDRAALVAQANAFTADWRRSHIHAAGHDATADGDPPTARCKRCGRIVANRAGWRHVICPPCWEDE